MVRKARDVSGGVCSSRYVLPLFFSFMRSNRLHIYLCESRNSVHPVELHQLNPLRTAEAFLDSLLKSGERVGAALADTAQYAGFVVRSAGGIVRSWGTML